MCFYFAFSEKYYYAGKLDRCPRCNGVHLRNVMDVYRGYSVYKLRYCSRCKCRWEEFMGSYIDKI